MVSGSPAVSYTHLGETKWSFWRLFKYSLDGIVNFSQAPLSIASLFGLFLTFFAFFMVVFVFVRRLIFGDPVAGWASTVCIIPVSYTHLVPAR